MAMSNFTLSLPSKYVDWIRANQIKGLSALFVEKLEEKYPDLKVLGDV